MTITGNLPEWFSQTHYNVLLLPSKLIMHQRSIFYYLLKYDAYCPALPSLNDVKPLSQATTYRMCFLIGPARTSDRGGPSKRLLVDLFTYTTLLHSWQ